MATVVLALAIICTCTQAQENNIDYWLDRGGALNELDQRDEANASFAKAFGRVKLQPPQIFLLREMMIHNIERFIYYHNPMKNRARESGV